MYLITSYVNTILILTIKTEQWTIHDFVQVKLMLIQYKLVFINTCIKTVYWDLDNISSYSDCIWIGRNAVRTNQWQIRLLPHEPPFCSHPILMSSKVKYWTDEQQHGIYLLYCYALLNAGKGHLLTYNCLKKLAQSLEQFPVTLLAQTRVSPLIVWKPLPSCPQKPALL